MEFRTLSGHSGPVRSIHFFVDGRLISGADDNTLRVWSHDGHPIQTLRGHSERVVDASLLDAGERVISIAADGLAKVWNLRGYEESRVLKGKSLVGHADAVLGAAFSHDDKLIVTAGQDRTARIWKTSDGALVATLSEGHEFLTTGAALFPDGRRFATAAMDDTTRIWDLAAGTERLRIPDTGRTSVVAVSRDGRRIATGGDRGQAQVFDVDTGARLHRWDGHRGEVTAAAWAPGDKFLATADTGGRIRVHDPKSGELVWSAERHAEAIVALAFSADGSTLFSASADHTVGHANAADGKEDVTRIWRHPAAVRIFASATNTDRALTIDAENVARIWNPKTTKVERELAGLVGRATGASISADGSRAAIVCVVDRNTQPDAAPATNSLPGTDRTMVQFFDLSSGNESKADRIEGGSIWTALFTGDPGEILTVGGNGSHLWNLRTRKPTMNFLPHGAVAGADFSPDDAQVVTASWDKTAKIWNVAGKQAVLKLPLEHQGRINAAHYSPDGKTLLTVGDEGTAILWNAADATVVFRLTGHATDARVRAAAWYADGSRVVTAGDDGGRVWNAATGAELRTLAFAAPKTPLRGYTSAAVADDGKRIVLGNENNVAILFDGETYEPRGELAGHTAQVTSVAVSPGGTRVLTGSADAGVKLWDPATLQEILTLTGHEREVTSVAFSHDGRLVLSTSRDGTGILWLSDPWKDTKK
ncbi:MAG: WD40 repeat domain-containing protein [Pirellulales bacterium]